MLGMPAYGWSHIKIGDFEGPASYLTDVANDCLIAMIHYFETGFDFVVNFDAEGWTFKIIADDYNIFVIEDKNEPVLHTYYGTDVKNLAKEIITDIEEYFDEWVRWDYIAEEDDGTFIKTEEERLKCNLNKLKNLITD